MNRRLLLAVGASALITAGSLPAMTYAAGPTRPTRQVDVGKIDPSIRPLLLQQQARTIDVVLQLGGTPAVQSGITRAAQRTRAAGLATAQKAVATAVARHGAKVTARYQYVYNGLRVRTSTDKLDALTAIPGVVAIRPVHVYERTNTNGVPYVNGPATWTSGATGDGVIIAVIDTGIDYTHASFGGEGTASAFSTNDGETVETGSFPTPKVIAGHDLVGDAYDANGELGSVTPTPDPDPIDCAGHGSHVAGTAAGFGVLADHSTFTGRYTSDTVSGNSWTVGPGVAPEAKLVALRVFGCEGSTDVVVEALEWVGAYNATHPVGIDIVNMSLGAPFGSNDDPDAVATNALVSSGVTVVASAGNEGPVNYITGAPAAATKAISVAALDALPSQPMAKVQLPGGDITGISQNAHPGLPVAGLLHVLAGGPTVIAEGCSSGDYDAGTAGKIVAVRRGTCPFVDKGELAEAAGAIGIVVVNRDGLDVADDELPAFLGYNPEIFDIPMVGVARNQLAAVVAGNGLSATLASAGTQANPAYGETAGFSSNGPRWGDSRFKADVAAPGVSILSTAVGSGYRGTTFSGTSMAAPMTAGAAALVIQAHPGWSPLRVKAALSNTADRSSVAGYSFIRSGAGAIRADHAAAVDVIATTSDGTASLSYGYVQAGGAWSSAKTITITNDSPFRAVFTLASTSPVVRISATSIAVAANSSGTITATASLTARQVNRLCAADPWDLRGCAGLNTRSGAVVATPVAAKVGQDVLRVPFLVVPRGTSSVRATRTATWTRAAGKISGRIRLANTGGHAGTADVYALGITDGSRDVKLGDGTVVQARGTDVRAAGVQVLPAAALDEGLDPGDRALFFAVNMHDRFSTAAPHEVDIAIDTTGDRVDDYIVFGYDYGYLTTGVFSGEWAAFVFDLNEGPNGALIDAWLADAPYNGSTVLLPVPASDLGLAAGDGGFTYRVFTYDGFTGAEDATSRSRLFDAYAPRQSTGQLRTVAKGDTKGVEAWFYRVASVRGWLVVTMDDRNGAPQADIVGLPSRP